MPTIRCHPYCTRPREEHGVGGVVSDSRQLSLQLQGCMTMNGISLYIYMRPRLMGSGRACDCPRKLTRVAVTHLIPSLLCSTYIAYARDCSRCSGTLPCSIYHVLDRKAAWSLPYILTRCATYSVPKWL